MLDQTILTSPMIKEPIFNGQGEITGRFSSKEAKELAVLLRSGALPAKLTVVEEQIIESLKCSPRWDLAKRSFECPATLFSDALALSANATTAIGIC